MLKDISFMDDDPNLINPIDFQTIKDSEYMNFVELREDFAWFVHNCLVKYPSGNSKTKKDIPKAANKLLQGLEQEIQNLKLCSECYENAYKNPDNSFMMPCKTPHILLWVDCVQYGFWPAKLMKYVWYLFDFLETTQMPVYFRRNVTFFQKWFRRTSMFVMAPIVPHLPLPWM